MRLPKIETILKVANRLMLEYNNSSARPVEDSSTIKEIDNLAPVKELPKKIKALNSEIPSSNRHKETRKAKLPTDIPVNMLNAKNKMHSKFISELLKGTRRRQIMATMKPMLMSGGLYGGLIGAAFGNDMQKRDEKTKKIRDLTFLEKLKLTLEGAAIGAGGFGLINAGAGLAMGQRKRYKFMRNEVAKRIGIPTGDKATVAKRMVELKNEVRRILDNL